MDPNSNMNQDPTNANNGGATSFAADFDMSAINEAVAAGGEANNIQNSFDVNDIELANTPTTDVDLQRQLADDPNMSLANSTSSSVTVDTPAEKPADVTPSQADPLDIPQGEPTEAPAPAPSVEIPEKKKSKAPTYVLVILGVIAVAATVIATIVSAK